MTDHLSKEVAGRTTSGILGGLSLARSLEEACKHTIARYERSHVDPYAFGWVDSWVVADKVYELRTRLPQYQQVFTHPAGTIICDDGTRYQTGPIKSTKVLADQDQTRDYVQHVFREMRYGCRYAYQHMYMIHTMPQCGALCRARREEWRGKLVTGLKLNYCPDCHIAVPATGQCDWCGEFLKVPAQTP